MTKTSDALAQNSTGLCLFLLRKDCLEGEARAVRAGQRGEEGAGVSSKQALEGGSSEDGGERLK